MSDPPGAYRIEADASCQPDPCQRLWWRFDTDRDGSADIDRAFGLAGDTPLVGDWLQDPGALETNLGVARPGASFLWFRLDTDGDANEMASPRFRSSRWLGELAS